MQLIDFLRRYPFENRILRNSHGDTRECQECWVHLRRTCNVFHVWCICRRTRARDVLLRTPAIVTRVTELKVEYTTACERALYSRFCSLSADEYCSTRSCETRRRYVAFAHDFLPHFVPLVSVSIAKIYLAYFFFDQRNRNIYRRIYMYIHLFFSPFLVMH